MIHRFKELRPYEISKGAAELRIAATTMGTFLLFVAGKR